MKYLVGRAFERAIERAGVPDSVAVRIDKHRSYQPDALVYCGQPLPGDALEAPNPVVVVEILSPSNAMQDLREKLVGYFQVPSIVHYLIADPDDRPVIHHARGSDAIATRILSAGSSLRLDPPGIELAVVDLFLPA
jgi:Uma2 family endonuclease